MKKLNFKIIFGIIFILLQIILFSVTVSAWWDPNWIYKQEINLTSATSTPNNYTVNIILDSSNVGSGFNWNTECSNNKSRIRFIDETDINELYYWVEECSIINQNMSVWINVEDVIPSSGYSIYLYYGNTVGTLRSDPSNTFDFYLNLNGLTMQSEGAGQDTSGNGDVLDSGRTFHTWGNSWKVFSGFTSYQLKNTGTQILEINMKSNDCGEIVGTEFDTDLIQSGLYSYRWCGTQTNWGITPDKQYTGGGNWQTVYTILNDFTTTPTHIHLPIDDDADLSGDVYFKDFRIRKYLATAPIYDIKNVQVINTTVQSLSPIDNITTNNVSISFTCNAVTTNTTNLKNISLYGNWGSGWHLNETKTLSGQLDSATFTKTFNEDFASYKWNCKVYDDVGFSDFYDINYTLNIDKEKPQININSPIAVNSDFTPRLNISFDKFVNAWYNINGSANILLCNNCISSFDKSLYLAEGDYILNIFANDSSGNFNSTSKLFSVNMYKKYIENFEDNFSIENIGGAIIGNNNLSFVGGTSKYNGIEIGYKSSNLNFFRNQWGGSANAGEVDITCAGGDANCQFEKQDGTIVSTPIIDYGVTTTDSVSGVVGFIMYSQQDIHTRWTGMHAQQSDYYVAVCYNSGQWYYDDNNVGCTKAFTPVSTDVLVANLTWGITSVSGILSDSSGSSSTIFKQLNTTYNITSIENVIWSEFGTDANNKVKINLSFDGGNTWHNTSNGFGISNITQNDSMIVKVILESDGNKVPGIYNFSIYWDNVIKQIPSVNITNPINNSKFVGSYINLTWEIIDNQENLNCSIYVDDVINLTRNCSSLSVNNQIYNFSSGLHSVYIKVNDSENYSIDSDKNYFNIIDDYSVTSSKSISYENSNMYKVKIIGRNIIDYVSSLFSSGSFSPLYDWINISSNGENIGFDSSVNNVNYSISGTPGYSVRKNYVIGID